MVTNTLLQAERKKAQGSSPRNGIQSIAMAAGAKATRSFQPAHSFGCARDPTGDTNAALFLLLVAFRYRILCIACEEITVKRGIPGLTVRYPRAETSGYAKTNDTAGGFPEGVRAALAGPVRADGSSTTSSE